MWILKKNNSWTNSTFQYFPWERLMILELKRYKKPPISFLLWGSICFWHYSSLTLFSHTCAETYLLLVHIVKSGFVFFIWYKRQCINTPCLFQVTRQALKIINPQYSRPLHVSFDIDVLDPGEAPATGTPGNANQQWHGIE